MIKILVLVIEVSKEVRNEARQEILRQQKYQIEYLDYLDQFIMEYQPGDNKKEQEFFEKEYEHGMQKQLQEMDLQDLHDLESEFLQFEAESLTQQQRITYQLRQELREEICKELNEKIHEKEDKINLWIIQDFLDDYKVDYSQFKSSDDDDKPLKS